MKIRQYVIFRDWIFFTQPNSLRFMSVALGQLFILFYCQREFHGMDVPSLSTHSPVEGHLGAFQFLAITNKSAMLLCAQVSV